MNDDRAGSPSPIPENQQDQASNACILSSGMVPKIAGPGKAPSSNILYMVSYGANLLKSIIVFYTKTGSKMSGLGGCFSTDYNIEFVLPIYVILFSDQLLLFSGHQVLDKLEKNSRTVKGANIIAQDYEALSAILLPLKTWSNGSPSSLR